MFCLDVAHCQSRHKFDGYRRIEPPMVSSISRQYFVDILSIFRRYFGNGDEFWQSAKCLQMKKSTITVSCSCSLFTILAVFEPPMVLSISLERKRVLAISKMLVDELVDEVKDQYRIIFTFTPQCSCSYLALFRI